MRFGAGALVVGAVVALLLGGCGAGRRPVRSAPVTTVTDVAAGAPPAGSTGYSAGAQIGAGPPDADGNPACPAADSWGAGQSGIAVSYWAHGADFVTVLVRTTRGPDVARSVSVEPGQALQLFEFPDADPTAVREVLIITNERRCYASVDPGTFRR
ncbi:MAG TPA: hypothetical protein VMU34_16580 [Mycobacterium sp.]|nr:hypothetical protein [Mycobacterium sp.]